MSKLINYSLFKKIKEVLTHSAAPGRPRVRSLVATVPGLRPF